jgi:N-acetylglutamate synthase-like GNAT family acetyltransferase
MLNFFTKSLIKRQLKDVPEAEIEKLFAIVEKNPEFFTKIAAMVQEKVSQGMSQEEAVKSIMESEGDGLKELMSR